MKKQFFFGVLVLSTTTMSAQDWSLTGNAGTSPISNYVGTSDSAPLVFRVNNQRSGLIEYTGNTFLGYQGGFNNTGTMNTGLGYRTMIWNTTGSSNTASGGSALLSNTTGSHNTANGKSALSGNTTGGGNVAIGENALATNVAGNNGVAIGYGAMANANSSSTAFSNTNVAIGFEALRGSATPSANTGFNNIAIGSQALSSITYASDNVAIGFGTLPSNVSGHSNTATGTYALYSTTTGGMNTASGEFALYGNTNGTGNCAIGYHSLEMNVTGDENTAIGKFSNISSSGLNNTTALGYGSTANASNKVRIGSSSVTVVEGQVAYTTPSDARFKQAVRADVQGLDFILQLRPVSYTFDRYAFAQHINEHMEGREEELKRLSQVRTVGFLAQEVEKTVAGTGFTDFDAVHVPENEQDNYGLAYAQFVVPLVKAVQELHAENEKLRQDYALLKEELEAHIADMRTPDAGVQAANEITGFSVFPNPAKDKLQLQIAPTLVGARTVLEIQDAAGEQVLEREIAAIPALLTVDISPSLADGTYLVILRVEGQAPRSARVVVNR